MLRVNNLTGFGAGGTEKSFNGIIQGLGLGTSLLVCLDAGDINSYDGSSQTWANTAPGSVGTDFYRGSGSGSDGADPTFNGTAGALTESEYFSHDGGDYFTEVSSGWGDDEFHKDGATFTIAGIWYIANFGNYQGLYSTAINLASQIGIHWFINVTNGIFVVQARNGSGLPLNVATTMSATNGAWAFGALSVDENGGSSSGLVLWNSSTETFNPSYTSPSSSAATQPSVIGWASFPLRSGSRIGALGVWNRALSSVELASLRAACKAQRWTSLP